MDELAVTPLGLLLTQVRYARRALEDIERETAAYGTLAFTSVFSAGAAFGAPPLLNGALRVHVENLSDLIPGSGIGGMLDGLLGGAGRLVGNLVGGVVGGTISTPQLIAALPTIERLAARTERLLKLLGVGVPDVPGAPAKPAGPAMSDQLAGITAALDGLTGLFLAAGGQPGKAAQTPEGDSPAVARWAGLADSVTAALTALRPVVDGLLFALPLAITSIAWLISSLPPLRVTIADMLQFLLRNALLLRGALLVIAFETLALVARLAASVVDLLATALSHMLATIVDTVRKALLAVLELGAVVGDALKAGIDALLAWLVPAIDTVLRDIGNTRVFRVITHLVRILPAVLSAVYEIKTGSRYSGADELDRLSKAPFLDITPPGAPPAARPESPAKAIGSDQVRDRLNKTLDQVGRVGAEGLKKTSTDVNTDMGKLAGQFDKSAGAELKLSDSRLGKDLETVNTQSTKLSESLVVPEGAGPPTGLEAIAHAYEAWLAGGGLDKLLGRLDAHFTSEPGKKTLEEVTRGTPNAAPRATIQIDELLIEVEPATPKPAEPEPWGPGDYPLPGGDDLLAVYADERMWTRIRGGQPA